MENGEENQIVGVTIPPSFFCPSTSKACISPSTYQAALMP